MYRSPVLPKGVSVGPQTLKDLAISDLAQRHGQLPSFEKHSWHALEGTGRSSAPAPRIKNGTNTVFFELKGLEDLNIGAIGGLGGKGRMPIPKEPDFYKDRTIVNSLYFTVDACIKNMLHGTLTAPEGDVTYRALRKIVGFLVRRNVVEKGMFCDEFGDRRFFSKRGGSEGVSTLVDELINQGMVTARPSFTASPIELGRTGKALLAAALQSKGHVKKGYGLEAAEHVVGTLSSLAQEASGSRITKAEIIEALGESGLIKNAEKTFTLLKKRGLLALRDGDGFKVVISGSVVQQDDHSKDRLELTNAGLKLAATMGLVFEESQEDRRHSA